MKKLLVLSVLSLLMVMLLILVGCNSDNDENSNYTNDNGGQSGDFLGAQLTAEQARAFAKAIEAMNWLSFADSQAGVEITETRPAIFNLSDDVILLVLAGDKQYGGSPGMTTNAVLWYSDGEVHTEIHRAIGFKTVNGQQMLVLYSECDNSATFRIYHVVDGALESHSEKHFGHGIEDVDGLGGDRIFRIDGVEVDDEDYWDTLDQIRGEIDILMKDSHMGLLSIPEEMEMHFASLMDIDDLVQMFMDHTP